VGANCGETSSSYASPEWDLTVVVPHGDPTAAYHADWTTEYTCFTRMDCTVQRTINGGVEGVACLPNALSLEKIIRTRVQINFDMPCNF